MEKKVVELAEALKRYQDEKRVAEDEKKAAQGALGNSKKDLVSVFKPLDLHGRYPQQGRRWGSP
jgi:hypothetical protein